MDRFDDFESLIAYSEEGTPLVEVSLGVRPIGQADHLACPSGSTDYVRSSTDGHLREDPDRVIEKFEWREIRNTEAFRIIAERTISGWQFFDKSVWEVRWWPMAKTQVLVAKAERLAKRSINDQAKNAKAA